MRAKQTFFLGTAIKISTVLSLSSPSSVKITIYDSSLSKKVDNADMTKETDTIYAYIYQSVDTGVYGDYIAHIEATFGSYTAKTEQVFAVVPFISTGTPGYVAP